MSRRTVVHVLPHTHWDREWYEPFEGYRLRLVRVADALVDVLERDAAFHFHFDGQTAAIEDYLSVRPERRERVAALVRAGRLAVGPWRILMDEFLCSGETIVRNLRQGIATARALGADPRIGYIPDSFGHIAQMPQILALAGMRAALVWRGVPFAVDRPLFAWEALDGTTLPTVYLATSYSNAATLPDTFEDLMVRAKRIADDLAPFRPGSRVLAMCGSDHLGPQAHLSALFADANERQDAFEFRIAPLAEHVDALTREGDSGPRWRGEMRSSARANLLMGVLSARMPLKQAEFAASGELERYAEPLVAIAGLDPGTMLDEAWRMLVENSAHDSVCGCGIDPVADDVAARYERATRIARGVAQQGLETLAARAPTDGGGVLVFNPSPFERDEPVEATVTLPGGAEETVVGDGGRVQVLETTPQIVVDMTVTGAQLARIVPTIHSRTMGQLHVNRMALEPGRVRTVRLEMGPTMYGRFDVEAAKREVEAVANAAPRARFRVIGEGPPLVRALLDTGSHPGLGWRTSTLGTRDEISSDGAVSATGDTISNGIVEVRAGAAGGAVITAGGVTIDGIGLEDGADAGDEYTYAPPARDLVVSAPASSESAVVADGPLEATIVTTQRWRVPVSLDPARRGRSRTRVTVPVELRWSVRAREPFARLTVTIDNIAEDHRIRLRIPLPFAAAESVADTAFGIVRRGLVAEGAAHETPTPAFPSRRWVDVSDGTSGVAVLHRGTPEYEVTLDGRALEITLLRCVGWLSRQDCSTRSGPAGPMLPAPGAQLLGRHVVELAIAPHAGDHDRAGITRLAETFAYPMRAIAAPPGDGSLPASAALRVAPAGTVLLSALERRGDRIEARLYNASDDVVDARVVGGDVLAAGNARRVNLLGEDRGPLGVDADGAIVLPLRAWEIATVAFG